VASIKPREYAFKFDIGEKVRFVYEHPVIKDAVVVCIIIWGDYTIRYRCAYMLDGERHEDVFSEMEIRADTVRGKGGKRYNHRAKAKKTGGAKEKS